MKTPIVVHSCEIIDLISAYPKGVRLSRLMEIVSKRFGTSTKFQTGSLMGMDLDDLLVFLEARNKVRVVCGVVYPSSAPVYAH